MSILGISLIISASMAVIALLGGIRKSGFSVSSAFGGAVITFFACIALNWPIMYWRMPMHTVGGLWMLVVLNLAIATFVVLVIDAFQEGTQYTNGYSYRREGFGQGISLGSVVGITLVIGMLIIGGVYDFWTVKGNDSAQETVSATNVVKEDPDEIPDTDANHIVIVSGRVASFKAGQALSSGSAAQAGLNTYFNVGSATLQSIDSHMWYAFPLEFDGIGNKKRQNAVVPGYVLVDAEDPDAESVVRIGKDANTGVDYNMVVSIKGGQSAELKRHVYSNGYAKYNLVDSTLEIADDGHPYFTVALQSATQHWSYDLPVGMLVVDANNGQITRYDVDKTPEWVDRVYSSDTAKKMMDWWGLYAKSPYQMFGGSKADRFKVSGEPQLVYTKGGHPAWRMLMTSFNADTSVNFVVLFDARSNTARVYTPQKSIATEAAVLHSFEATAQGGVKANSLIPTDLTLHKLYGRLTWVVSYISSGDGDKATFQGVGLLDAYDTNGATVVFGKSKGAAFASYQTQIAGGNNTGDVTENANATSTKGVIANRTEVVEGGQTFVYFILEGDSDHVYRGQASADKPELIFSEKGDAVVVTFLDLGDNAHLRNVGSFDVLSLRLNSVG